VSLSVTRLAMYAPVVVLLSAPVHHQNAIQSWKTCKGYQPSITPSLKLIAMLVSCQSRPVVVLGAGSSHIEVPRLETVLATLIWRIETSYFTSPFFSLSMSTWMPSDRSSSQLLFVQWSSCDPVQCTFIQHSCRAKLHLELPGILTRSGKRS
jgi:hypothetical protein